MNLKNKPASTLIEFNKIPVIFLSFDEPNADLNYAHLRNNHPNPEIIHRVHGVRGLDAVHKAAAKKAGTERFFTVDADCIVSEDMWNKSLKLDVENSLYTFSWSSVNAINGLVYGNGGVKLWTADFVREMKTHEASEYKDGSTSVEFCWDKKYQQLNTTYGVVYNNASAYQAFRSGFREGVKMGLDQGNKVPLEEFKSKIYPANYARWLIWMTIGRDVENGNWAMYGARLGAYMLYVDDSFDHTLISDYDWFLHFWDKIISHTDNGMKMEEKSHEILTKIVDKMELPLVELDADQSIWFKHVNFSPLASASWASLLNQSALPIMGFEFPW